LAVRELAIQKGLFSHEDHRRFSEWAETIGPSRGYKLVAKVWTAGGVAIGEPAADNRSATATLA